MESKNEKDMILCPCCMKRHPKKDVRYRTTLTFKGVCVEYDAVSRYCKETDEYFSTEEMLDHNDKSLKDAYRAATGLMKSAEIKALRDSYGISQQDLCILLGWGEKTLARYEGHQVQDKAHNLILVKLRDDPEWFIELLKAARDKLPDKVYAKCMKNAERLYSEALISYENKAKRARLLQTTMKTAAL